MARLPLYTFAGLLLALLLPAPASADPAAVPDTPAVSVVRQFLVDRAVGKYAAAYALLSSSAKEMLPYERFAASDPFSENDLREMPEAMVGIIALFYNSHAAPLYTFTLVGPDPAVPAAVLVRAVPAAINRRPAVLLRLLTVRNPAAPLPHIDVEESLLLTAPKEFAEARNKARRAVSLSNLRQIALGIIQYNQDHDEKMPDAANWVDEIMPYVKSEAVFHDPSAPAGEKWSYAFNRTLSHQPLATLDAPAETVMLFESNAGVKNASDAGQSVPVPGRHLGGTDYALADGHAKWFADGTKLSYRLDGK